MSHSFTFSSKRPRPSSPEYKEDITTGNECMSSQNLHTLLSESKFEAACALLRSGTAKFEDISATHRQELLPWAAHPAVMAAWVVRGLMQDPETVKWAREQVTKEELPNYVLWTVDTWASGKNGRFAQKQFIEELTGANLGMKITRAIELFVSGEKSVQITGHGDLQVIPDSICFLYIPGDLYINNNPTLGSLPASFGDVQVGGSLHLDQNPELAWLPDSFGNVTVGQDLWLGNNEKLAFVPGSFGEIEIKGSLHLDYNPKLTTLPGSFGKIRVGKSLYLDNNNLTTLPESFGNVQIGESLYLDNNNLTTLPESFWNVQVGTDIFLRGNPQLVKFPESFETMGYRVVC
jgi:hypothetical protein